MNQDPLADELTIEEAADVLNVSPAFVGDLVEGGTFRVRSGGVDLLATTDVLAYRDRVDAVAGDALDAMTADAEAADLCDE